MMNKENEIKIFSLMAGIEEPWRHLNCFEHNLMNKNNMVISNEDVQKIKNYTEDVKKYNPDSKKCQ